MVQLIWQKTVIKVSICHCVKSFQIRSYFWSLYPVFGHISRSLSSGYDGKVSWKFGNDLASYIVIFSVDITSSSHIYGGENDFSVLVEGPADGINGSIGASEKKF